MGIVIFFLKKKIGSNEINNLIPDARERRTRTNKTEFKSFAIEKNFFSLVDIDNIDMNIYRILICRFLLNTRTSYMVSLW